MTSREIIRRTIEYSGPERIARTFDDSDMRDAFCIAKTHATDWRETGGDQWERTDEWGNTWRRIDDTSKGEVAMGVLEADRMHKLHDRIDNMVEDMIRNYAAAGVDGVMFLEDWGTQCQTLISPDMWRTEFFPRFVKLCGIAHDLGIKVFMHSCGKIEAIVPGLMEAGIDVLQFDQPDLHGLDILASHQKKGKITFWCPVDIQKTLQLLDENIIRRKAREMIDKLWHGRGGFIAGFYVDNESIGLDPKWQGYACDEFSKYGVASQYKRFCQIKHEKMKKG